MPDTTKSPIQVEKPAPEKLEALGVYSWPVWTKETSEFPWHYEDQEVCYFLEGQVTVKTRSGSVSIGKGDLATFPKGLDCTWVVEKPVKKHYRFG